MPRGTPKSEAVGKKPIAKGNPGKGRNSRTEVQPRETRSSSHDNNVNKQLSDEACVGEKQSKRGQNPNKFGGDFVVGGKKSRRELNWTKLSQFSMKMEIRCY